VPIDIRNFDVLEWLNNFFGEEVRDLNYDQLRPVLSFALIWNFFESKACNRRASLKSVKKSVDEADSRDYLTPEKYRLYVDYFRDRYLEERGLEFALDQLILTDVDSRRIVTQVLTNERTDLNNVVYALLVIALRIRNNLFHGNKEIDVLPRQTELFSVVNNLLADYVEDITHHR